MKFSSQLFVLTAFLISNHTNAATFSLADWMKSNCPTCSVVQGDDLMVPYSSGMLKIRVLAVKARMIRMSFLRMPDANGTYRIFYNADKNPAGRSADAKALCDGLGAGWKPAEVKYQVVYRTDIPNTPPSPDYETVSILECKKGLNILLPTLPGPTIDLKINVNNKDRESGKEGIFINEKVTIPMTIKPQSTSQQ